MKNLLLNEREKKIGTIQAKILGGSRIKKMQIENKSYNKTSVMKNSKKINIKGNKFILRDEGSFATQEYFK